MVKVLAFAGSLRKESVNKKLINYAAEIIKKDDLEIKIIDINDFNLPIYNQDIDAASFPDNAKKLAEILKEYDAWLISTPEHNYSMPSAVKNIIDFVSRAPDNKPNFGLFSNKTIALMSASPSPFGGFKALKHLREILTGLGSMVVPAQFSLSKAYDAFDENGQLINEMDQKNVKLLLDQFVTVATKLA